MADFCQQCSINLLGEYFGDLSNLGDASQLQPGEGWTALCEGCGSTVVDSDGWCIAEWCPEHGTNRGGNDTPNEPEQC